MKKVAVEQAVGMKLCHDITEMRDGFKGVAFKRNTVIREEDVEHLLNIGKRHVFVWDETLNELHEDDCAQRLAAISATPGAVFSGPAEGKMLMTAENEGLFTVDEDLLNRINHIGDITITSIPNHYPVKPGMKLASMRIVPLTTEENKIVRAEELAKGRRLFNILPYRKMKTGIIVTGSEVYHWRIKDKFEPVLRSKLASFPAEILGVTLCDDDLGMITGAAGDFLKKGADLIIFTGGMSVDPDDLTPGAIKSLGAEIISYGMPAQPGNMTLVAYLGGVTLLGVPGAAIALPVTMLDVLLPQIFTGVKFTREDILNLGAGGLCQGCSKCHFPNCTFGRY